MNLPLPLIEFIAFIGVVLWLFTMQSSPLRRDVPSSDGAESTNEDGAAPGGAVTDDSARR